MGVGGESLPHSGQRLHRPSAQQSSCPRKSQSKQGVDKQVSVFSQEQGLRQITKGRTKWSNKIFSAKEAAEIEKGGGGRQGW